MDKEEGACQERWRPVKRDPLKSKTLRLSVSVMKFIITSVHF